MSKNDVITDLLSDVLKYKPGLIEHPYPQWNKSCASMSHNQPQKNEWKVFLQFLQFGQRYVCELVLRG